MLRGHWPKLYAIAGVALAVAAYALFEGKASAAPGGPRARAVLDTLRVAPR